MVKLNIGCGDEVLEGYINLDPHIDNEGIIKEDFITYAQGIEDNYFDEILCEAVLEHTPHSAALGFLMEMFRILKPGGKVDIVVPDMDYLFTYWHHSSDAHRWTDLRFKIFGRQDRGGQYHLSPWNTSILEEHLQRAGFSYQLWHGWSYNQKILQAQATKDPAPKED